MAKSSYIYAKYAKSDLGSGRIILVVPSKTVKLAVLRNKLRRRTREILRNNPINIKSGYDLVLIFQKGAEKLDFQTLKNEITRALGN